MQYHSISFLNSSKCFGIEPCSLSMACSWNNVLSVKSVLTRFETKGHRFDKNRHLSCNPLGKNSPCHTICLLRNILVFSFHRSCWKSVFKSRSESLIFHHKSISCLDVASSINGATQLFYSFACLILATLLFPISSIPTFCFFLSSPDA